MDMIEKVVRAIRTTRGEASPPAELADELASAKSQMWPTSGPERMEIVTFTCSAANRALIVEALRRMARH